jgi:hypothetical protein
MSRLVVLLARTRPTGRMSALWSGEDRDDDDRNFVSCSGLAPVVAFAQRCGLPELVAEKLTLPSQGRGERAPEGPGAGGRDGRRGGLDR